MFGFKKAPKELKVGFYEGLQGISKDQTCSIFVSDSDLLIKKQDSEITLTIPFDQISAVDIMWEKDFRSKYHNTDVLIDEVLRMYYIIDYTLPSGEKKHIAFRNDSNPFTTDKFYKLKSKVEKHNKK